MTSFYPLGSTIVLLLALLTLSPGTATAQLPLLNGCATDVLSPVPDNATREGWREYAKFTAPAGVTASGYGTVVAIHGSYAVVGAPFEGEKGTVFVYYRDITGWTLQQTLTPPAGDRSSIGGLDKGFGYAVDVRGDKIIVGSPYFDSGPQDGGTAYIFQRTGTSWAYAQTIRPFKRSNGDNIGISVALSDQEAWVGGYPKVMGYQEAGAVWRFAYANGSYTEDQNTQLIAENEQRSGYFGNALAVSDDGQTLAVGASRHDKLSTLSNASATDAGSVCLFRKQQGQWIYDVELSPGNLQANDRFGHSVAFEGNDLIVGAPGAGVGSPGKVYILKQPSLLSGWSYTNLAVNAANAGRFGSSLSVAGDSLLIGSPGNNTNGTLSGAATLYAKRGGSWTVTDAIAPIYPQAGGHFGGAVAMDHGYLLVGGADHDGAQPAAGATFLFEENYRLPDISLIRCADPVTAPTPLATDNCAGKVMGSSVAPVTYNDAGTRQIVWNFTDGKGNFSSALQDAVVELADLSLPYTEHAGTARISQDCWSAGESAEKAWGKVKNLASRLAKPAVFALQGSGLTSHFDKLRTPQFDLEAGKEYLISFDHGVLDGTLLGNKEGLRLGLVDHATGQEVKQLFRTEAVAGTTKDAHLIFTVPATGRYRLTFDAWGGINSPGLVLDNIRIQEHTPANGWPGLTGNADDQCTEATAPGLNGFARARILDAAGRLVAEIDANGNDLGDVRVAMTDYADVVKAPFNRTAVLSRYFDIVPEHGSGPYLNNGGVKVRLYFAPEELAQYNLFSGQGNDWSNFTILHYSDVNQDCDISNSTGGDFRLETLETTASFSAAGRYLEFTTQSFSEFSAASAQSLPVTLTAFAAAPAAGGNALTWTAEDERDFSHYTVERSADGSSFVTLGTVAGRNAGRYTYLDAAPLPRSYYRLRLVDRDGTADYSRIVSVTTAGGGLELAAYPVPSAGTTRVRYVLPAAGPVEWTLLSPTGRVVERRRVAAAAGANVEAVDLSALPAGAYYLSLRWSGGVENLRLARQ